MPSVQCLGVSPTEISAEEASTLTRFTLNYRVTNSQMAPYTVTVTGRLAAQSGTATHTLAPGASVSDSFELWVPSVTDGDTPEVEITDQQLDLATVEQSGEIVLSRVEFGDTYLTTGDSLSVTATATNGTDAEQQVSTSLLVPNYRTSYMRQLPAHSSQTYTITKSWSWVMDHIERADGEDDPFAEWTPGVNTIPTNISSDTAPGKVRQETGPTGEIYVDEDAVADWFSTQSAPHGQTLTRAFSPFSIRTR